MRSLRRSAVARAQQWPHSVTIVMWIGAEPLSHCNGTVGRGCTPYETLNINRKEE